MSIPATIKIPATTINFQVSDCRLTYDGCKQVRFDSWGAIVCSCFFWGLLYNIARILLPHRDAEFCNRLVTLFHGTVASISGLALCFGAEKWPLEHPSEASNSCQYLVIVFTLSYFLMDIVWCTYYQTESALMMVHHVFSATALFVLLFREHSGAVACCGIGAMEITNPLLQLRWFIRTLGHHQTLVFTTVELTFMAVFIWLRIVLGTGHSFSLFINPRTDPLMRVIVFLLNLISWGFFINMVQFLIRKYVRRESHHVVGSPVP